MSFQIRNFEHRIYVFISTSHMARSDQRLLVERLTGKDITGCEEGGSLIEAKYVHNERQELYGILLAVVLGCLRWRPLGLVLRSSTASTRG